VGVLRVYVIITQLEYCRQHWDISTLVRCIIGRH